MNAFKATVISNIDESEKRGSNSWGGHFFISTFHFRCSPCAGGGFPQWVYGLLLTNFKYVYTCQLNLYHFNHVKRKPVILLSKKDIRKKLFYTRNFYKPWKTLYFEQNFIRKCFSILQSAFSIEPPSVQWNFKYINKIIENLQIKKTINISKQLVK